MSFERGRRTWRSSMPCRTYSARHSLRCGRCLSSPRAAKLYMYSRGASLRFAAIYFHASAQARAQICTDDRLATPSWMGMGCALSRRDIRCIASALLRVGLQGRRPVEASCACESHYVRKWLWACVLPRRGMPISFAHARSPARSPARSVCAMRVRCVRV